MNSEKETPIPPQSLHGAPQAAKKSIVRSGLSLSVMTLASRILGLVREMTKASFLGTSSLADAFGVAFMIPNLFRRLFAENSISVAFIPTFRKYLTAETEAAADAGVTLSMEPGITPGAGAAPGTEPGATTKAETGIAAGTGTTATTADSAPQPGETRDFVNATYTLLVVVVAAFVALGMALTPLIVQVFAGKETAAQVIPEMTVLTRIMFPYLFLVSLAAFYQGLLNGVKIFSPSGFTPVLFNALVIAGTYLLAPHMANPARAMAVGVLAGGAVQALFQLPFVAKAGWAPRFTSLKNAFTNPGTRKVLRLIVPTIVGMAAYQLNDVVCTALAGRAGTGIVSSLQYSLRLQELILGIFAVSIGTVILPDLSAHAQKNDYEEFNRLLLGAIRVIAVIAIPVTFYSYLTGEHIIRLVYQSRSFTEESVFLTLGAFRFHIAGLFFIALNRIISPAFYAQSNTKVPALAGIINFAVNITLALMLVKPMSGGGIALALTVASAVNTVVLFAFMRRGGMRDVGSLVRGTLTYTLRIIVFSAVAAVPTYVVRKPLVSLFAGHSRFVSQGVPLVGTALVFFAVGVGCLVVTRDPVVGVVMGTVKRKLKK